jgi:hypothetical protein
MAEVVLITTAVVIALPVLISLAKALLNLIRKTLFAKVLEKDVQDELEKLQKEVESAEEQLQDLMAASGGAHGHAKTAPTASVATVFAMEALKSLLQEIQKRVDKYPAKRLKREQGRGEAGRLQNGVEESKNKKDKQELEHFRNELARCLKRLEVAVVEDSSKSGTLFCSHRLKRIVDKYICGVGREYKIAASP